MRLHHPGVDPGKVPLHAEIVDEISRRDVVGSVEDHVAASRQLLDVGGVQVGCMSEQARRATDALEGLESGSHLGLAEVSVALVEQHLSRQVRPVDDISIDEHQRSDPAAHERLGELTSQRPAAHDENARIQEPLLALGSQRLEPHLTVESIHRVHGCCRTMLMGSWRLMLILSFPLSSIELLLDAGVQNLDSGA